MAHITLEREMLCGVLWQIDIFISVIKQSNYFYPIKDHELPVIPVFSMHFSIVSLPNKKLISLLIFDLHAPEISVYYISISIYLTLYLSHGVCT